MMLQAVLFDLDDTLLGNDMDTFIPSYFGLLSKYAEQTMPRDDFLRELMICSRAMVESTDTSISNRDVFWNAFQQRTGLNADQTEAFLDIFYRDHFPKLAHVASPQPAARDIVGGCFARGLQVVIATNPMFPRRAVEHRLDWAGLPVTEFPFALVTTYENMHATKPHTAYYQEILDHLGVPAEKALMVGDDWENDIEPAARLGCLTYWIAGADAPPPEPALLTGYGSLARLNELLATGWPENGAK
jgi:FMN phosphatase YigB (HAD superfamily)